MKKTEEETTNKKPSRVSYEAVGNACQTLLSRGESISTNKIRKITTRGGNSTIKKFMDRWISENKELITDATNDNGMPIPTSIKKTMQELVETVWHEAQYEAQREVASEKSRLETKEKYIADELEMSENRSESFQTTIIELRSMKDFLSRKNEERDEIIFDLKDKNGNLHEEILQAEHEADLIKLNNTNLQTQLNELEEKSKNDSKLLNIELNQLKDEIQLLKSNNSELTQKLRASDLSSKELLASIKAKTTEIIDLKKQNKMYETDFESEKGEKIKVEIICEKQRTEINSLTTMMNKMNDEMKLLISSEKEEAVKAVERVTASSTSVTVKAISEVVSLVPSEAVRVKLYEVVVS